MPPAEVEKGGEPEQPNGATSLRVYLELEPGQDVEAIADRVGDLLLELGFNNGDRFDAAIACVAETPDVAAWAESAEDFLKAMQGCAFLVLPRSTVETAGDEEAI